MSTLEDVMQELSSIGALQTQTVADPKPIVTEEAVPEPLAVAEKPRADTLEEQLQQWESTISALAESLSVGLAHLGRAQEMIAKARVLEQCIRTIR